MRTRFATAGALMLLVAACSDSDSTTNPIAVPDQKMEPTCVEPPDSSGDDLGRLVIDTDQVSAGGEVAFRWEVAEGTDFLVGDELFVECWTGESWESVWVAGQVFSADPIAVLLTAENRGNLAVTQDGFVRREGVLPIPEGVRPGVYRVVAEINLRSEGSSRPAIKPHSAFLVVSR